MYRAVLKQHDGANAFKVKVRTTICRETRLELRPADFTYIRQHHPGRRTMQTPSAFCCPETQPFRWLTSALAAQRQIARAELLSLDQSQAANPAAAAGGETKVPSSRGQELEDYSSLDAISSCPAQSAQAAWHCVSLTIILMG